MDIFGISEEDFLDPTKVKIIDGIAGAGKSSLIDAFFKDKEIPYMRCTSTNALKRDAEERYGIECETIAGGLFTTEDCHFFMDEKDPDIKTIVIDEILQTSKKVLSWIKKHKDTYNIIVTTDTCQMLSQESGNAFLEAFLEYAHTDDCIYVELTETKRARDEQTKEAYSFLYGLVKGETKAFEIMKGAFPSNNFEDIKYNSNDVFICHTKEIEDMLYQEWGLETRYDLPLIPKGTIARKQPKDITRYPIYSQNKSERHKNVGAYVQIKNIATPTRYQGSEVTEGQKLYFIIEDNSIISNRELYTVLTRCYHMSSMELVYINIDRTKKISEFCGLPVTKYVIYEVKTEEELKEIKSGLKEDVLFFVSKMRELQKTLDIKKGAYHQHCLKYDGTIYTIAEILDEIEGRENTYGTPKFTARSLVDKEAYFDYTFMDDVYKVLNDHSVERINYCHYKNKSQKSDFSYDLDLFSAYPAILKFGKLPIDGKIYTEYDKNKMNFFLYKGQELTENCIITDAIADYVSDKEKEYLFSTDYRVGSKMGDYLWEKAHKTEEDKKSLKSVHYGYWQKPFLESHVENRKSMILNEETKEMEKGTRRTGYYVRIESHNHELLMVSICCEMLSIILKMIGVCNGYVQIDALHFNDNKNIQPLKNFMATNYPNLDYRIEDKINGKIIYKSYEDLKTKKEVQREQARLRKQKQRMKEKEKKEAEE